MSIPADTSSMDAMHIVMASDENYAQHLAVALLSLLRSRTSSRPVIVHVLGDGLTGQSVSALAAIAQAEGAEVRFPAMDMEAYEGLVVRGYLSRAMFARLSAAGLVEADRAIYLDCDIIVRHDLSALWDTPLEGNTVGAVSDPVVNAHTGNMHPEKRLGLEPGREYFNSGVLLMDLQRWREDAVAQQAVRFINDRADNIMYPDQDGLNAVLQGKWLGLHPRWNTQTRIFQMGYRLHERRLLSPEMREALRDPAVVHYVEAAKPWHYECTVPYTELYYRYLAMTPWSTYRPSVPEFKGRVKKLRRLIWRRLVGLALGYRA